MTWIELATATGAPLRGDERAARTASSGRCPLFRAAAQAAWTSTSVSHESPLRVPLERCLAGRFVVAGHSPAHDARWSVVGNTAMPTPISATIPCPVRLVALGLAGRGREQLDLALTRATRRWTVIGPDDDARATPLLRHLR